MAVKKVKPKPEPKVALKEKVPAANIAQAGIIRALKTRGFSLAKDISPYEFTDSKTAIKIIIHPDKAIVENTKISVPLGKGAIHELMKQIKTLEKK
jgi:hypothetical protein